MRPHDQLQKQQDLHIKKAGLHLVDWLAKALAYLDACLRELPGKRQDIEIYFLVLNENQCAVEFKPQKGKTEPWSDGGGVCGVVMTNVKWPRVGTGGR